MPIQENIQLLGTPAIYKHANIPQVLTLQSLPTISELEYVSAEDFDEVMLSSILPRAIKESIDCKQLLEIDYQWILRALRILNYGPHFTTNTVFCPKCGRVPYGEYSVDLTSIECKPLPANFSGRIKISAKEEFIEFQEDIEIHLLTIQETLTAYKDTAFLGRSGNINRELARTCYMISKIGAESDLSPVDIRMKIENNMCPTDYLILKKRIVELTDYGLRAGGVTTCPKCGNTNATFVAFIDDRYFRPTLDNLRAWKADRDSRRTEVSARTSSKNV